MANPVDILNAGTEVPLGATSVPQNTIATVDLDDPDVLADVVRYVDQLIGVAGSGGGGGAAQVPLVGLRQSAPQAVAEGAPIPIEWDVETADALGFHAGGAPEDIVVPVGRAGKYTFSAAVTLDNPTPGDDIETRLLINGTPEVVIHTFSDGSSLDHTVPIPSVVLDLAGGDTLTLDLAHNEGADLNTVITGTWLSLVGIDEAV